jgi:hypothetical protein
VGAKRVIWHVGFERNLKRRGPRSFEIRSEVPLSDEPARLDYLLLRKRDVEGAPPDDSAETLRRLWALLPRVTVMEYKSPGRPYRAGNLDRLWGYVHTYFANERSLPRKRADGTTLAAGMDGAPEVWTREDLCAVLVVPARTPTLTADAEGMGLAWNDLGNGYSRVRGGLFVLYVAEIDVIGRAEGDDLLCSLGHGELVTSEARRFWMELVGTQEAGMSTQDLEGYDELMKKLLATLSPEQRLAGLDAEQRLAGLDAEQRLAGLDAEQRLAGLDAEQRLAGLDRDHQALALPLEVLRLLPDQYFRSLSPEVQAKIRGRLAQNGH